MLFVAWLAWLGLFEFFSAATATVTTTAAAAAAVIVVVVVVVTAVAAAAAASTSVATPRGKKFLFYDTHVKASPFCFPPATSVAPSASVALSLTPPSVLASGAPGQILWSTQARASSLS